MIDRKYPNYFWNNRKNGIYTETDDAIIQQLDNAKEDTDSK
jgi:hypothetical protein